MKKQILQLWKYSRYICFQICQCCVSCIFRCQITCSGAFLFTFKCKV